MAGNHAQRPQRAHAELPRLRAHRAASRTARSNSGYRVSVACRMAVESYRQGRTVRWDPAKEEIV